MRNFIRNRAIGFGLTLLGFQGTVIFLDLFMNTWIFDEIASFFINVILIWLLKLLKPAKE